MKIRTKLYCNWNKETKSKLKKLVLSDGFMQHYILAAPKSRTFVAFSPNGQIVGWTLVLDFDGIHNANTYVAPAWRQRGVGTKLILRAAKWFCPLRLYYWNTENQKLFLRLHSLVPNVIEVADWYDVEHKHVEWLKSAGINV